MSVFYKFKHNYNYKLIINIFIFLFSINYANAKSAPESFADLAEKLSPSVVNISTTTIVEQKSKERSCNNKRRHNKTKHTVFTCAL